MMLRTAGVDDLPDIYALLTAVELPTSGVRENLDTFTVSEFDGSIAGVGGLEFRGSFALLRSLAVAAEHRYCGWALAICDRLETEAMNRGVTDIYLLTETAEGFFSKRGYSAIARSEAPSDIVSSEQFARICPASAVLMRRSTRHCAVLDANAAGRSPRG